MGTVPAATIPEPEGFCRSDEGPPEGRDVLGEVDQPDTGTAVGLHH